jgi:hypothetical protein
VRMICRTSTPRPLLILFYKAEGVVELCSGN